MNMPSLTRVSWTFLSAAVFALFGSLPACDDDPRASPGTDVDSDSDSDSDADTDSDSDMDSDSDGDSDVDSDSDGDTDNLCDEYPSGNFTLEVGDVVRNYTMWDRDDVEHQMCEYGGGENTVMFLTLTHTS